MKNFLLFAGVSISTMVACQNNTDPNNDPVALSKKAIEVHDLIMPQISVFNKQSLVIDSVLANLTAIKSAQADLDTTSTRQELTTLKADLESATDKMMLWMREYTPDSISVDYQKAEIQRIDDLRSKFEKVTTEANKRLAPFQR